MKCRRFALLLWVVLCGVGCGWCLGGGRVVCGGGSVAVKCPETVQLCMHMYINTSTHTHIRQRASKSERSMQKQIHIQNRIRGAW